MSKACIAAQFVCDYQDDLAIQSLSADLNPESIKLLSLLLRKQRKFDDEQALMLALHQDYPNDSYIQERYQWHQQLLFDKLVPRQPLHLPCDPLLLPKQSTLDQLCIVTGGDDKYFDFIVECIESVKNSRNYHDRPVCILDYGLTDAQKQILATRWRAIIRKPNLVLDVDFKVEMQRDGAQIKSEKVSIDEKTRDEIQFFAAKTCLPQIFPDYRYFLWVDADAWIQDDRALDVHAVLCEKQGMAGSCHGGITFGNQFGLTPQTSQNFTIAPPGQINDMLHKHAITVGTFCLDAESIIAKTWFDFYKGLIKNYGYYRHHDELSLTYLCHKYGAAENVKFPYGFHSGHEGFPVVCAADDILRRPSTLEPVGIPHLVGSSKQLYMIPTQQVVTPLNPQQVNQHKQLTSHWFHNPHQKIVPNQVTTSIRFRVWPWDVSEVNRELYAFAKEILCHA